MDETFQNPGGSRFKVLAAEVESFSSGQYAKPAGCHVVQKTFNRRLGSPLEHTITKTEERSVM